MFASTLFGLTLLLLSSNPAAPTLELVLHEGGYEYGAVQTEEETSSAAPVLDGEIVMLVLGDEGKPIILAQVTLIRQDNLPTYCLGEDAVWTNVDNDTLREQILAGDTIADKVLECRLFNQQLSIIDELHSLNLLRGIRPEPEPTAAPAVEVPPPPPPVPFQPIDPRLTVA